MDVSTWYVSGAGISSEQKSLPSRSLHSSIARQAILKEVKEMAVLSTVEKNQTRKGDRDF